jgi:hypothetical protein
MDENMMQQKLEQEYDFFRKGPSQNPSSQLPPLIRKSTRVANQNTSQAKNRSLLFPPSTA